MSALRILARSASASALIVAVMGGWLQAQGVDSLTIIVRVVDSAGSYVTSADVAVRARSGTTVARGQTDNAGRVALTIASNTPTPELFVRHVGFRPYTQTLPLPLTPSGEIAVVLADLVYSLDTVSVISKEPLRRRTYYIDSTTIAHSPRQVFDGWDILRKLRPDIAYGRDPANYCPGVQNVFVNGKWIVPETVVINPLVALREPNASASVTPHLTTGAPGGLGRLAAMSILASIKPEHIAEMTFRDCRDKEIAGSHSRSALFVVLAPGIGFDLTRGTYVIKPKTQ